MLDGEACARPARPTRSLRAPHQHDFDARAFTRALYAGGQNHAGPANIALVRQSALRPLRFAPTIDSPSLSRRRFKILPLQSAWFLV